MPESQGSGTFFSCVAQKTKSMKPHNIALMIFFFFAGAALLVALRMQSKMDGNTLESRWKTTIEDLYDNSSTAHIRSLRYDSYAHQAAAENDPSREQLFLALAHSERIHEQMCARAAQLFGGSYVAPYAGADISTSTDENLKRSLAATRTRHNLSQGKAATRAIENGNRYVARILIWIDGCNRRHLELLEESHNHGKELGSGYLVCPKCGNVYNTSIYDVYCPFCQTHYTDFTRFE